jgi:hypothetical protein
MGVQKVTYVLRTSPAFLLPSETIELDDKIRRALEDTLSLDLDEKAWTQASLPVRMGGMGIRSATDLALPAFLASVHSCDLPVRAIAKADLSFAAEAMSLWDARPLPRPSEEQVSRQKGWDQIACEAARATLLSTCESELDAIRLAALSSNSAGAWLDVFPSDQIGTHLQDSQFRAVSGLRLGIRMFEREQCSCGEAADDLGLHRLSALSSPAWFKGVTTLLMTFLAGLSSKLASE